MELIDKDALVAEIDRRIRKYILLQQNPEMYDLQKELQDKIDCLNSIKGYITNILEVKEVNLEEEIDNYFDTSIRKNIQANDNVTLFMQCRKVARHFFELGLNANNNSVIEKACDWLKNNVTYTHPRTGETKCAVNLNAFIDAMKGE